MFASLFSFLLYFSFYSFFLFFDLCVAINDLHLVITTSILTHSTDWEIVSLRVSLCVLNLYNLIPSSIFLFD